MLAVVMRIVSLIIEGNVTESRMCLCRIIGTKDSIKHYSYSREPHVLGVNYRLIKNTEAEKNLKNIEKKNDGINLSLFQI